MPYASRRPAYPPGAKDTFDPGARNSSVVPRRRWGAREKISYALELQTPGERGRHDHRVGVVEPERWQPLDLPALTLGRQRKMGLDCRTIRIVLPFSTHLGPSRLHT